MTVQDDPEVPRSVHGSDGRREYGDFVHVDFLHLLSGAQPDKNCLCRVETLPASAQPACDVSDAAGQSGCSR